MLAAITYFCAGSVVSAGAFSDFISLVWDEVKESHALGPALGIVIGVLLLPLRQWLTRARVRIVFAESDALIGLHERVHVTDGKAVRSRYIFCRGYAKNLSSNIADQCRVYLTRIEKMDEEGRFHRKDFLDNIQLAWSARPKEARFDAISLPKGLEQCFDVFLLNDAERERGLQLQLLYTPTRYTLLCSEPGTYRFTVLIAGQSVVPRSAALTVEWTGEMEGLRLR
ncbi:MAG: hypothetical protein AB7V39_17765 [Nitrospiraceae bacterium]